MRGAQRLVHRSASTLRLSVILYDPQLQVISHSAHGDVDEPRAQSILTRRAPMDADAVAALTAEGTEPCRIPAAPAEGTNARACTPVRIGDRLFGYVMIV